MKDLVFLILVAVVRGADLFIDTLLVEINRLAGFYDCFSINSGSVCCVGSKDNMLLEMGLCLCKRIINDFGF